MSAVPTGFKPNCRTRDRHAPNAVIMSSTLSHSQPRQCTQAGLRDSVLGRQS
ncbi:MAG: hypothetical protein ABIP61_04805 [Burkholderiaceae bacterium]